MASSSAHRRLAAFASAVVVGHHVNTILGPLGDVGTSRWADWVDLLVPFAVVASAAATLAGTEADRRDWIFLGAAAVLFTEGHGIHLAAISIAGFEPSDAAHLWDEAVGHWLWYTGLAGIVATLAHALRGVPSPRSASAAVLSLAFGITICTNSIEGGTVALGFACALLFVPWGVRRRGHAPELLVPAYGLAFAGLAGWGLYWQGFPQFSELGWI